MFKRILVPIDGSPTSLLGLRQAIKLSRLEGARMRLVNVVDELPMMANDGMGTMMGNIPIMLEGSKKLLAQAASVVRKAGIEAQTSMIESMSGNTAELVAEEARKWRADVIVLGTHGRSGLERVFMGSSAEEIVRATPVPVLLVRARDEIEKPARKPAAKRKALR